MTQLFYMKQNLWYQKRKRNLRETLGLKRWNLSLKFFNFERQKMLTLSFNLTFSVERRFQVGDETGQERYFENWGDSSKQTSYCHKCCSSWKKGSFRGGQENRQCATEGQGGIVIALYQDSVAPQPHYASSPLSFFMSVYFNVNLILICLT